MCRPIRNPRNSLSAAGMLILFESFLGILDLDHHIFFHHIVPQIRPSIWHFENSSPLLWNPKYFEKSDLPEHFASTFSFVMPFSHESEHTKLMTSLIINLSLAVFYRQLLPWEGLNKPRVDPDSSSRGHFTPCPPWPVSSAWLFCEASSTIFQVLLRPRQSLWTVCFWMFALSAASPVLHKALLCRDTAVPGLFHSPDSLRTLLLDFPCATPATPIA